MGCALMRVAAMLVTAIVMTVPTLLLGSVSAADSKWLPKLPRGQGEQCVAETDWMRRNHMTVLMHQRDKTVHDGIRTKRFSLKGCVECHAVRGADNKPVTIASPKHFCRACHDYTAVRMDCFECHASRPEAMAPTPGNAATGNAPDADVPALAQYLRSVER
jgi:predicted CXXCH cytochrome family protein